MPRLGFRNNESTRLTFNMVLIVNFFHKISFARHLRKERKKERKVKREGEREGEGFPRPVEITSCFVHFQWTRIVESCHWSRTVSWLKTRANVIAQSTSTSEPNEADQHLPFLRIALPARGLTVPWTRSRVSPLTAMEFRAVQSIS